MTEPLSERAVLITARNLGDAVISLSFLQAAGRDMPAVRWHVWCRPQVAFLFEGFGNVGGVSTSHFPMGTAKQFDLTEAVGLGATLLRLRKQRYDFSVDLTGDVREVSLGRLASRGNHYVPRWPADHPFSGMHYLPRGFLRGREIAIPAGFINIYRAYAELSRRIAALRGLGRSAGVPEAVPKPDRALRRRTEDAARRVGVHPFASQECKLWRADRWRELISELQESGIEVLAFGAPAERDRLKAMVSGLLSDDAVITDSVEGFFAHIRGLDFLVGLDSFSVHAAYVRGVPALMINGSNHPELFCPPGVKRLAVDAQCGFQPCLNVPKCIGKAYEYTCTRDVPVREAFNIVSEALGRR